MLHNDAPLPSELTLEYTILGTALVDPVVLSMAIEKLIDDDFYSSACQEIFKIAKSMVEAKIPFDIITLNSRLEQMNRQDLFTGVVSEIIGCVGVPENCEGYIEALSRFGVLRRLVVAGNEITRLGYDYETDFDSVIDQAEGLIQNAISRAENSHESDMAQVMSDTVDHLNRIRSGEMYGLSTGFEKMDKMLCGYEPANLIIIAGRPSSGKTSYGTATALNLAVLQRIPVAIFSLETSKIQLGQRMTAQWAEVNLLQLRNGYLPKDKYRVVMEKMPEVANAPIYIDDESMLTLAQFRSRARKMIQKYGVQLFIIDFLQLMGRSDRDDENAALSKITRGLKTTAKDFNIPIIALSQLSRANEKRVKNKTRPQLSDLRGSGSIEQDADVVIFTHREWMYDKNHDETDAELIIGKQKNGPTETVNLYYIKNCSMFKNDAPGGW